jgi:hypothetical protein
MPQDNLQSAHPIALMFLYFFRIAAIVMYILGGYFNNYVLSVRTKPQTHFRVWVGALAIDVNPDPQTVIVVVLLSMDFWNCRVNCAHSYPESGQPLIRVLFQNVSGRVLVGLRYWNQVGYAPLVSWCIMVAP